MKLAVTILAGGQGTRFWPASRTALPKQFLALTGNHKSLIQQTADRMKKVSDDAPFVITGANYRNLIMEHLPECKIICEPSAKNTAPAIGLAALKIRRWDPNAVMIVLPSDHMVKNEEVLIETIRVASELASTKDLLVTIGIKPSNPNTGYGYIKLGPAISGNTYYIDRFYEKPNLERARKYVEEKNYFWNSGMFIWKASTILTEIRNHMPDLHEALMKIDGVIGTELEEEITTKVFNEIEGQSIDFGVLEHSRHCAVITSDDFGWSDVGSWDAWSELFTSDENSNFIEGDGVLIDSKKCIVKAEQRFIAVLGCDGIVVVETPDAVLVCQRESLQDIKKIVNILKTSGRGSLI